VSRLFDRRWRVTIDTIETTTLDCDFTVEKSAKPEPNTCDLTIYNLTREHQAELEELRPKDKRATTGIPCRIEAGYVDPGPQLIWLGDLRTIETTRQGPDWVTHATSGDGERGWQNGRIHVAYGPKTPLETALRAIARELGVAPGNLSKIAQKLKIAGTAMFPSGKVFSGSASRALVDFARSADLEVSIQDGALQFIDRGKALAGESLRLSSETGLIGSPTVDNEGVMTCEVLMIPGVRVGSVVVLDAARVKGAYKVEQATWSGSTSGDEWGITLKGKRY
jgi:hypothetical protein